MVDLNVSKRSRFITTNTTPSLIHWTGVLILLLLASRLVSLGLFPLYDTTEARYAEMARLMVETKNWITPQFDYGVPFWGKPPFQTWISALGFSWFGISEFSARIPHFICGLMTCYLVMRFTRTLANKYTALLSVLILTSSLGFIIAIGMVMTDSALLMAYTLAMVSYWQCYSLKDKVVSGHVFFAALALGMLIKGPVAVVLIGISLVVWSIWQGCFKEAVRRLPWFTGIVLFMVLTVPWYAWAEIRTPGFLEYFILGEHIQRFLVSGWQGDLYGTAHVKPRGMIWLYWLVCASPWSFIALRLLVKKYRNTEYIAHQLQHQGINKYLVCWMISPLLLFTFAGNILPIYVLPGFSALAILVALNSRLTKVSNYLAFMSLMLITTIIVILSLGIMNKKSEAELLNVNKDVFQKTALYYWRHRPFSAQFYSKGHAQLLQANSKLKGLLHSGNPFYVAIEHSEFVRLRRHLQPVCVPSRQSINRLLLKCH
ncbi:ArnT family glycosyltransferase [Pseudoalteromonas sp. H105]|uniref:ArnT family glycosyltransferase n=1 Tax=Pseudoalteromonas sp. H105 TaxID=1348393 RepID=UPI000732148D|nr:glycosyltransferase family 39 protein [Pseudoalteromonas sp. H105]KTF16920.1 hypothetical protein ATS75_05610 [Pseudoalteromonas sp. H105]